jgi:hypothetical protein
MRQYAPVRLYGEGREVLGIRIQAGLVSGDHSDGVRLVGGIIQLGGTI